MTGSECWLLAEGSAGAVHQSVGCPLHSSSMRPGFLIVWQWDYKKICPNYIKVVKTADLLSLGLRN